MAQAPSWKTQRPGCHPPGASFPVGRKAGPSVVGTVRLEGGRFLSAPALLLGVEGLVAEWAGDRRACALPVQRARPAPTPLVVWLVGKAGAEQEQRRGGPLGESTESAPQACAGSWPAGKGRVARATCCPRTELEEFMKAQVLCGENKQENQ